MNWAELGAYVSTIFLLKLRRNFSLSKKVELFAPMNTLHTYNSYIRTTDVHLIYNIIIYYSVQNGMHRIIQQLPSKSHNINVGREATLF